jgi:hypothetical protein
MPERILVQGPTVSRSFQERAAAAKLEASAACQHKGLTVKASAKVSFIAECLQVCFLPKYVHMHRDLVLHCAPAKQDMFYSLADIISDNCVFKNKNAASPWHP